MEKRFGERSSCLPLLLCKSKKISSIPSSGFGDAITHIHRDELTIGQILGNGGFAQVYEVVHQPLSLSSKHHQERNIVIGNTMTLSSRRPRFAIKVLRRELLANKSLYRQAADDLLNEAKILFMLDHPNIIKLRALPTSLGRRQRNFEKRCKELFLVIDRLEETLADRIERWKMGSTKHFSPLKVDYALQLAKALQYLHSHRILMRDVKPDNIGFLNQQTLQVFDFGLSRKLPSCGSRDLPDNSYKMTICGTQRYLPKEVVLYGKHSLKCDVYSFSMVFWEMLTHTKPFHYMTPSVHKILVCERGDRPPLEKYSFPFHVWDLLQKTWADHEKDRPSMTIVCERLHAILRDLKRPTNLKGVSPYLASNIADGRQTIGTTSDVSICRSAGNIVGIEITMEESLLRCKV